MVVRAHGLVPWVGVLSHGSGDGRAAGAEDRALAGRVRCASERPAHPPARPPSMLAHVRRTSGTNHPHPPGSRQVRVPERAERALSPPPLRFTGGGAIFVRSRAGPTSASAHPDPPRNPHLARPRSARPRPAPPRTLSPRPMEPAQPPSTAAQKARLAGPRPALAEEICERIACYEPPWASRAHIRA